MDVDEDLAQVAAADEQGREAFGRRASLIDEPLKGALEQRLGGERGERRLFGRLPDDAVAADERQRGVPRPHGDGEVEGRDDAGDAERMPALHHPMTAAFRRDGEAVKLA